MSKAGRFVNYLVDLERRDAGAMAALRRGLTERPGDAIEMHQYVARWASGEPTRWREDAYYLIASLFALHPRDWPSGEAKTFTNFGASFARLAAGDSFMSVEKRFFVLLRAGRDDLHLHLRHAVRLMKTGGVPVDWRRLLDDVARWEDHGGRVARNWARAFYFSAYGNGGSNEEEE